LNAAAFRRCLQDGKHREQLSAEAQEGRALGISATPTIFINGRMTVGLAPAEVYAQMIREELARAK
jgi:protein-disulfide isomerase